MSLDLQSITDEWLQEQGFRWHQLERQTNKQWLLWVVVEGAERVGLELAKVNRDPDDHEYFCWFRSDLGGRYSRFIHIRYLRFQYELILLIEAVSGEKWNRENVLYGQLWSEKQAVKLREDEERLDRRITKDRPWHDLEKDSSRGGALPEHTQELHDVRKKGGW